jgi:hypothetical protein
MTYRFRNSIEREAPRAIRRDTPWNRTHSAMSICLAWSIDPLTAHRWTP